MMQVFVWTPSDVFGLLFAACILIVGLFFWLATLFQQLLCKHDSVRETMACDAVCRKCGKNLGFIGTWRKSERSE